MYMEEIHAANILITLISCCIIPNQRPVFISMEKKIFAVEKKKIAEIKVSFQTGNKWYYGLTKLLKK